ncbi:MAG: helix-turn-helix domain-containing protein [Bacilli bacterium]|nr:helix-turn-helix domain-containing protein [Bacilli bacterium]
MSLGERLYELRKKKGLSQEEVAERLNVTRQSVSKWETDESKPDFDKIVPICELYEISTNELLNGTQEEKEEKEVEFINKDNKKKRALFITSAIFLYFLSIIWIIVSEVSFNLNEGFMVGGFFLLCGIATCMLIYQGIVLSTTITKKKKEKTNDEKKMDGIIELVSIIFTIIYLLVSFATGAWHITWIIWLVFAAVQAIIKIAFGMKGDNDNE